jgi:hypothetical protein
MNYGHRQARKDIRFIFSEEGLADSKKSNEIFIRMYNFHLLDKRKDKSKGKKKPCERCFRYYFRKEGEFANRNKRRG